MIPKINNRGHSFKGVTAYLMHDKESASAERVAWTHTGNMHTQDIEKAALVMAWTDKNAEQLKIDSEQSLAGAKSSAGAVYHYSLSWAHDEQPDEQHQKQAALETLKRLGLSDHQFYIVAHDDTKHLHLHVVANLTHPETGKRQDTGLDKRKLQEWALEYEREHGFYCQLREENAAKREGREVRKYRDQKQAYAERVTRAYYAADSGKAFANSLESEGLHLAKGRRGGFVIVDEKGDIQKLGRQLEIEESGRAKTAAIKQKLADLDKQALPDAEEIAAQITRAAQEKDKLEYFDREAYEAEQQSKIEQAAIKSAQERENRRKEEAKAERQRLKAEYAAKAERYAKYQKYIDRKTEESRKKWDIDELTQRRDKARAELEQQSGLFARLFGKQRQAAEALRAAELTLNERLERWRADIEAFNNKRPQWLQKKELEKRGFVAGEVRTSKTDQEREKMEAQQSREDKQEQLLHEAGASLESAERLAHTVSAKSAAGKAKVSKILAKAALRRSEKAAIEKDKASREQVLEREKERRAAVKHGLSEGQAQEQRAAHDKEAAKREAAEARREQIRRMLSKEHEQEKGRDIGGWSSSRDQDIDHDLER